MADQATEKPEVSAPATEGQEASAAESKGEQPELGGKEETKANGE